MTDEERRTRTPAPEVMAINAKEHPVVRPGELELHKAYMLHGPPPHPAFTLNYMGRRDATKQSTGEVVSAHVFWGPRIAGVFVLEEREGADTLFNGDGEPVTVRLWKGPDA